MVWRAKVWCASAFTCVPCVSQSVVTQMYESVRGDESDSDYFTVKGSLAYGWRYDIFMERSVQNKNTSLIEYVLKQKLIKKQCNKLHVNR